MGIPVIDGFSLRAKKPLDDRLVFQTLDEMKNADPNGLYPGQLSFCVEDRKFHQWNEIKVDWDDFASGGSDDGSATWESSEGVVTALGGIKVGTNLAGKTALEILDLAMNPYQSPVIAISINPATTLYEVGQSATIIVTANLTKKTEAITAAKILKGGADLKVASSDEITAKTFNQTGVSVSTDTSFSSKVSDSKGEVAGNTINVKFTRRSYYGVIAADGVVDDASKIEALTQNQLTGSKGLTWASYNANNQKVVYAYPKSFGDLTSIKDGNNFEMLGSFTKTTVQRDGVDYNVYTLTNPMSITGGKLVFA